MKSFDEPGRLQVSAFDRYETKFLFGYSKRVVLPFQTGCIRRDKTPGPHAKI